MGQGRGHAGGNRPGGAGRFRPVGRALLHLSSGSSNDYSGPFLSGPESNGSAINTGFIEFVKFPYRNL